MFYKRPSLRRGGMPTGIDTLSPRVKAQKGYFGETPLFFRDSRQIGLDFPSTMSGMQIPTGNQVMMKSFPQDASTMGVASVVKPKKTTNTTNDLDDFITDSLNSDFTVTETVTLPDGRTIQAYKEPEPSAKVLANLPEFMGGISKYSDEYKDLIEKEKVEKSKKQKTEETKKEFERPNMLEIAGKVVANKGDEGDADKSKDTETGGETVEDSFDSEYDKQMRRLEKYLGSTNRETKGRLALALSDAIGTEGTIADKASALNKSLLGIMGQRRKDKKELAKIAFAATTELEKAKITAGKKGFSERRFDEYANLASKKDRTKSEESRFQILKDALGIKTGLTGPSATAAGKIANEVNDTIIDLQTASEDEKSELQSKIISGINQLLLIQGVTRDNVSGIIGFDVSNYLKADGGRVNKAMGGGASETPAEPVATNLTFEQLRTRLPKEITDDIVKLVATSEEALQDFAYIRTQGDVEKFNVKYGVNLVLPQETA